MIRKISAVLAVLVSLGQVSSSSADQQVIAMLPAACLPEDIFHSEIAEKYEERPTARGLIANGAAALTLYASREGSWTVAMQKAGGAHICVLAIGDNLELIPPGEKPRLEMSH